MFTLTTSRPAHYRVAAANIVGVALLLVGVTLGTTIPVRAEYLTSYADYLREELKARKVKLKQQNVGVREYWQYLQPKSGRAVSQRPDFQLCFVAIKNLHEAIGPQLFPDAPTYQKYRSEVETAVDAALAEIEQERSAIARDTAAETFAAIQLLLDDQRIKLTNASSVLQRDTFPDCYDFFRFVASRNHVTPPQVYSTWSAYLADVRAMYDGLLVARAKNRQRIAALEAELAIERCARCPWHPPRRRPPQFTFHFARGP